MAYLRAHRMGHSAGQCRQPKNLGLFLSPGRQGIGNGQSVLARHHLSAALPSSWQGQKWFVSWEREVRVQKLASSLWGQLDWDESKRENSVYSRSEKKNHENKQTKKKTPMNNKWANQLTKKILALTHQNYFIQNMQLCYTKKENLLRSFVEKGNPVKLGNLCTK